MNPKQSPRRRVALRLPLLILVVLGASCGQAAPSEADRARAAVAKTQYALQTGLTTQDLTTGLTPEALVNQLVGGGVVFSNASYTGANAAAGRFSGGTGIIGFESGLILSSGSVANVVGPNDTGAVSTNSGTPGDSDLNSLAGHQTHDAAILAFDFVPQSDTINFRYVFASDEYNEYVNSSFNDTFGFFINGVNCAVVSGDAGNGDPVSVNTINNGKHSELYVDNQGNALQTEMDGLTTVLSCNASVTPNATNHAKLAIADASDSIIDSVVFIEAASFSAGITSVKPDRGGMGGSLTMTIYGHGFVEGRASREVSVVLNTPEMPDVSSTYAIAVNDSTIVANFDLTGQPLGKRALSLNFPDATSMVMPEAFTIINVMGAVLVLDLLGPSSVRLGRETTYLATIKNVGFNDVGAASVIMGTTGGALSLNLLGDPVGQGIALSVPSETQALNALVGGIPPGGAINIPLTYKPDKSNCTPLKVEAKPTRECKEIIAHLKALNDENEEGSIPWILKHLTAQQAACNYMNKNCPEAPGIAFGTACRDAMHDYRDHCVFNQNDPKCKDAEASLCASCAVDDCLERKNHYRETLDELVPLARGLCDEYVKQDCDSAQYQALCGKINELAGPGGMKDVPDPSFSLNVCAVTSWDPNDKVGIDGTGTERLVSGATSMPYTIHFENSPAASAPAQEVVVTDAMEANLDWSTFGLGPIRFGGKTVEVAPDLQTFATDIDLRPAQSLVVHVEASLNKLSGVVTWRFKSIDPDTGQPPADPFAGFLPPNAVPPAGEGSVFFTVAPKKALPSGTQIHNKATIVFDTNSPIDTATWVNTIDHTPPVSEVSALAPVQDAASFPVQWAGTDEGSGIREFNVYVSENGGPARVWVNNTSETSGTFVGQPGVKYQFFSVALDRAGNVEGPPAVADATTEVVVPDGGSGDGGAIDDGGAADGADATDDGAMDSATAIDSSKASGPPPSGGSPPVLGGGTRYGGSPTVDSGVVDAKPDGPIVDEPDGGPGGSARADDAGSGVVQSDALQDEAGGSVEDGGALTSSLDEGATHPTAQDAQLTTTDDAAESETSTDVAQPSLLTDGPSVATVGKDASTVPVTSSMRDAGQGAADRSIGDSPSVDGVADQASRPQDAGGADASGAKPTTKGGCSCQVGGAGGAPRAFGLLLFLMLGLRPTARLRAAHVKLRRSTRGQPTAYQI